MVKTHGLRASAQFDGAGSDALEAAVLQPSVPFVEEIERKSSTSRGMPSGPWIESPAHKLVLEPMLTETNSLLLVARGQLRASSSYHGAD